MGILHSDYGIRMFKRHRESNCYYKGNPSKKADPARKQKRPMFNARMPKTKEITNETEPDLGRRGCLEGTGPIVIAVVFLVRQAALIVQPVVGGRQLILPAC